MSTHSAISVSHEQSILIADVVSSTALYEELGDQRARTIIAGGLHSLGETVVSAGGRVIKSLGDGILSSFPDERAVPAAMRMIENMQSCGLQVRIGVHFGTVIEVNCDVFGDVVNTAARIASLARTNEILLSRRVFEGLDPTTQGKTRPVPLVAVKGKRVPLRLYSILDVAKDDLDLGLTVTPEDSVSESRDGFIKLMYAGKPLELQGMGSLQIGRSPGCEIQVRQSETSRAHAKIFYRKPHYVLADSSTNGTFLVPEFGQRAHILRRETILFGRGKIYPGARPKSEGALWLDFEVG